MHRELGGSVASGVFLWTLLMGTPCLVSPLPKQLTYSRDALVSPHSLNDSIHKTDLKV